MSQQPRRRPYLLLAALLLVAGFYAGTSWSDFQRVQKASLPRTVIPRDDLKSEELATAELFRLASPSVVYITSISVRRDFFSLNVMQIPSGTGSGLIWSDAGHIVTNYHVIQKADEARVTLSDQTTWGARLVGYAPEKDLAVLRIDAPREKLTPVPIGTSQDLVVGQQVYAIGNPFGLDQTLTTGIISALDREIESMSRRPIRGVIQTDAAINPGNSGGPLLDSSGRLIGVNAAIYSPSGAYAGIGFAIPVDTVNWVVPDLIAHGRVIRPALGIEARDYQLQKVKGVLVMTVAPGSGAAEAGIRPTRYNSLGRVEFGDMVVAVEGERVQSRNDLILALEEYQVGDVVSVTVVRDGNEEEVKVRLQESK